MGREVKRVPMDFDFPIDESYHDAQYDKHVESCDPLSPCASNEHDGAIDYRPPVGDGWQLWQTVSDGPVTPVFATADELIDYMCQPCGCSEPWCRREHPYPLLPAGQGWRREIAESFVRGKGWAPSFVVQGGRVMSGAEAMVRTEGETKARGDQ